MGNLNERVTEKLVERELELAGYFEEGSGVRVEEQISSDAQVKRLLSGASKKGTGRVGRPEFIISSSARPDLLIIVECKASNAKHESPERNSPVDYAVDGVLHYAEVLAAKYNVIGIAASGQTREDLRISTFLHPKGAEKAKELTTSTGLRVDRIIPFADFAAASDYDPAVTRLRISELLSFAKDLHNFMRKHAKVTESEKPLLVAGTLIALRNSLFAATYGSHPTPGALVKQWIRVIADELEAADMPGAKRQSMIQPYRSISVNEKLARATPEYPRGVLYEIVKRLSENVLPLLNVYQEYDLVGQFYGEFLKYAGGDGKGLGIVLTPRHITELFSHLAQVRKTDVVVDLCTGTGGFLISAMATMLGQALTDEERDDVRKNRLLGVEDQANMFALAASNMIFRGDGKANLFQGDCFDPKILAEIRKSRPTVGMINPPYSQEGDPELKFVKTLLDVLEPGGRGIAIVPISCAHQPSPERTRILKSHTLEAVMSMPENLFPKIGVITCIMVFTAHKPHAESNRKTWFGYWKEDGFQSVKNQGRVDVNATWPSIRDQWVSEYLNREIHAGRSVAEHVGERDEWCAEAYMETDYSQLDEQAFRKVMLEYAVYATERAEANEGL